MTAVKIKYQNKPNLEPDVYIVTEWQDKIFKNKYV